MWLIICYIYVAYMLPISALYLSYRHIWEIAFRHIRVLWDVVLPCMGNKFQVDAAYMLVLHVNVIY